MSYYLRRAHCIRILGFLRSYRIGRAGVMTVLRAVPGSVPEWPRLRAGQNRWRFRRLKTIRSVRALTQSWLASGIYHPLKMNVEVSSDRSNWIPFGSTHAFPSDTPNFAQMWSQVKGAASARYVRWTFACRGWFFLAELEVVGTTDKPAARLSFHR